MAQYIAEIQGQRGPASRLGSKKSGISAHVRGWNIGVRVSIDYVDGHDVVYVEKTGGSNGHEPSKHLATFKVEA